MCQCSGVHSGTHVRYEERREGVKAVLIVIRTVRGDQMTAEFESPSDLTFNRGLVVDPEAFVRDAAAASWLFLCGEEFAAMDGGISYAAVRAAVAESANVVSDPPVVLDMDLA